MAESALVSRVEALLQLRRWPEALHLLSGLVAAEPADANLLFLQARAYAGADQVEPAVTAARAASAANPTWDAPVRLEAAVLGPDQSRLAMEVARRATALGPVEAANWVVLADVCQRASFTREATTAATEARRLAPDSVHAMNVSGLVALRLGDHRRAEDWFRRGLALDPSNPHLLNNLALALGRAGRDDEAMELLERSLVEAPDGRYAWNNLGRASAIVVWRGAVRWLFFGGLFLVLLGLVGDWWPVALTGGLSLCASVAWVGTRQRRLSAARRQAIRDAARGNRTAARSSLAKRLRLRGSGAGRS